jgi:16S rRNA (cytidine1402-2'-O)-methyltransferase
MAGRLYLLPTWLAEPSDPAGRDSRAVLGRIRSLDVFIVEDAKSARRFLAACGHPKPMREIVMGELNEHTPPTRWRSCSTRRSPARTWASCPRPASLRWPTPAPRWWPRRIARGVTVVPCVGPSSILLALMASGLEGQRFRFLGYLPTEARRAACGRRDRAPLAPHRRDPDLHRDAVPQRRPPRRPGEDVPPGTRLAVAAELTSPGEWIRSDEIGAWRERPATIGKRPAIFLLLG